MSDIRLMLVDDEERFLLTTAKLLNREGMKVLTATGGPQALALLESSPIQVVILDVKMPDMDGVSVLKEIKARFPLTEVIMLTGHASVDSAIDGLKSGAFDYLTKPCDIDELVSKVGQAHERWRLHEQKISQAVFQKSTKTARAILKDLDRE